METGMVQVGDRVLVQPQNEGAVIKGRYEFNNFIFSDDVNSFHGGFY